MSINYTLPQLLKTMVDQNGTDLHITAGSPPRIRIDSALVQLDVPPLSPQDAEQLCFGVLSKVQQEILVNDKQFDLAFSVQNLARFRANIFVQRNSIAGAFRLIPQSIRTIDELGLPPIFKKLCSLPRGLVLVTGPTGSGKTTTLAAMVNHINKTRHEHIVTIEDPIEYLHSHENCVINQRELGDDTNSFAGALRSVLRQDPDIVMIGELRDPETIATAITTAETGHLVFATLHTNGCHQSLNRIIDSFPPHQQAQIRTQLSMTIEAIVSQLLVPSIGGGRALAMEVMVSNPAIKALVLEHKFNQIYSFMQSGQEGTNMQTMNQALYDLVMRRKVSREMALSKSQDPDELNEMLLHKKPKKKLPNAG